MHGRKQRKQKDRAAVIFPKSNQAFDQAASAAPFRFPRHQARKPPPATSPGNPAPTMGTGTATKFAATTELTSQLVGLTQRPFAPHDRFKLVDPLIHCVEGGA